MKNRLILAGAAAVIAVSVLPAFAASGVVLSNGGIGQRVSDPSNFGIAICNKGSKSLAQAVPLWITANGKSATINSAAPIAAGSCGYSYASYASLSLAAGNTYTVSVIIDPDKSVVGAGTNTQANYTITVPGVAASPTANATDPNSRAALMAQISSMTNLLQQLLLQAKALLNK